MLVNMVYWCMWCVGKCLWFVSEHSVLVNVHGVQVLIFLHSASGRKRGKRSLRRNQLVCMCVVHFLVCVVCCECGLLVTVCDVLVKNV